MSLYEAYKNKFRMLDLTFVKSKIYAYSIICLKYVKDENGEIEFDKYGWVLETVCKFNDPELSKIVIEVDTSERYLSEVYFNPDYPGHIKSDRTYELWQECLDNIKILESLN